MSGPKRKGRGRRPAPPADDVGIVSRRVALDALVRIDEQGAYANLVTSHLMDRSHLEERDRRFVTELVYGTTRMRRACDHLVDQHRKGDVTPRVRAALRMGAYQLGWLGVPPHAAVSATVSASPKPARGLVNAVLRRVAADVAPGLDAIAWPDLATERSYPDWIVTALTEALGADAAATALAVMNEPATTHVRDDGYVQDLASQRVVEAVGAGPGQRVLDLCAAPGGKATALAATGATVVAADLHPQRAALVATAARTTNTAVGVVTADATAAPIRPGCVDAVLVDAPCTGLGVLRRRPDARWRIDPDGPARLAELQRRILDAAVPLLAPGGRLVYSVCTLTAEEGDGVADHVDSLGLTPAGRHQLAPTADHDGMYWAIWQR